MPTTPRTRSRRYSWCSPARPVGSRGPTCSATGFMASRCGSRAGPAGRPRAPRPGGCGVIPTRPARECAPGLPDLGPILDEELAALPEWYREAILLCDLRGVSREEAALILGVPEGTVSSRLANGRKKLAARLARRGVSLSVAGLVGVVGQAQAGVSVPNELFTKTCGLVADWSAGGAVPESAHSARRRRICRAEDVALRGADGRGGRRGGGGGGVGEIRVARRTAEAGGDAQRANRTAGEGEQRKRREKAAYTTSAEDAASRWTLGSLAFEVSTWGPRRRPTRDRRDGASRRGTDAAGRSQRSGSSGGMGLRDRSSASELVRTS